MSEQNQGKWVEGYNKRYRIYKDGRLESFTRYPSRFLKGTNSKAGIKVQLYNDDGICFYTRIHNLVAAAFLPNPNESNCVHHINGDKKDNRVENLAWSHYVNIPKKSDKKVPDKVTTEIPITVPIDEEDKEIVDLKRLLSEKDKEIEELKKFIEKLMIDKFEYVPVEIKEDM